MCKHSDFTLSSKCDACKIHRDNTPTPEGKTRPASVRLPKEKAGKPKANIDPFAHALAEYMSGARCIICDTLRDGHGHCQHERDEIFAEHAETIGRFVGEHGDPDARRSRWAIGSGASALKRTSLQAGNRDADAGNGLTRHQLEMLKPRVQSGTALEWKNTRPSGDELPL